MSLPALIMYLHSLFKISMLGVVKRLYNLTVLGFVLQFLGKHCSRKCCRAGHSRVIC